MAVRRWDLEPETTQPRAALELASPPPSRVGHPVAASLIVLALVAALSVPVLTSSSRSPNQRAVSARTLPVSAIPGLDPTSPISRDDRPVSRHVVGGVAFVSCTR